MKNFLFQKSTSQKCLLFPIIKLGKIEVQNKNIKLSYSDKNQIYIFFDKKNLNLTGWRITDQYNNTINFSLNIVAKNDIYKKKIFEIPQIN